MRQAISELIEKDRISSLEWQKRLQQYEKEGKENARRLAVEILPNLKRAAPRHYKKWLEGFISRGGKPTHFYDYAMPNHWFVAKKDFTIFPLYGAQSISIIIPKKVAVEIVGGLGHNELYYMADYRHKGIVPVFSNTII